MSQNLEVSTFTSKIGLNTVIYFFYWRKIAIFAP